ncbi:MAG TPA: hypothetical protein VNU92_04095 [Edaphobacter sp.]|jgi:hypothetical protein|nr:hypothetical protein [Edaphobacter sp.]
MTSHMLRTTVLLASAFLCSVAAHGDTIYNEAVSGDLSNSGLTPTLLTVSLGSNDVFGTTGKTAAGIIDRDYFTFTVPNGEYLTAITVLPGTTTLGALGESFIGLESGPEVTVLTGATDATGLLGWFHYGTDDIGEDILPMMGTSGLGSTGFTAPLPAGTYSFWVQEASVGTVNYGLEFTVATPEPASVTMMLTGLAALLGKTARRTARSRSHR